MKRHGFTLVELLIVIAIISVAGCCAIGAILQGREKKIAFPATASQNESCFITDYGMCQVVKEAVMTKDIGCWELFVDVPNHGTHIVFSTSAQKPEGTVHVSKISTYTNESIYFVTPAPITEADFPDFPKP